MGTKILIPWPVFIFRDDLKAIKAFGKATIGDGFDVQQELQFARRVEAAKSSKLYSRGSYGQKDFFSAMSLER